MNNRRSTQKKNSKQKGGTGNKNSPKLIAIQYIDTLFKPYTTRNTKKSKSPPKKKSPPKNK